MKLHIRRISGMLAAVLTLAMMTGLAPVALAEDNFAMVTKADARIYLYDDLSGASAKLPKYSILTLEGESGGISQVTWRGKTGYVDASLISAIDLSTATEAEFGTAGRVYEYPTASSKSVKVAAGTEVNVVVVSGERALVERGGHLGYTLVKYLTTVEQPEVPETPKITYDEFEAVVTSDSLKVYASASTSANLLGKLDKGTVLTVTAYTDDWAYITYSGATGYCAISGLEKYVAPTPTPDDIFSNSSYSNEQKIFHFLVSEMGFNAAAACGVLANIDCESGFRPTAYNSSGGSYGICQWLGGRYTALKNYCADKGYDYTTLKGQLYYLKYELENKYPSVLSYMKSVDDSAQGAYDAGYHWCYYFEIPASRSSSSAKRGNIAKNEFWAEYK